jgi:hypothetical protein
MSAIAGVFSRRGAPRHPGEIDQMLAVMASRGPDGTSTWAGDKITLGYGALHATPESVARTDAARRSVDRQRDRGRRPPRQPSELINKLGLDGRDPARSATVACSSMRTATGERTASIISSATSRSPSGTSGASSCSSPATTSAPSRSPTTPATACSPSHRTRDRSSGSRTCPKRSTAIACSTSSNERRNGLVTITYTTERVRRYWHLREPDVLHLGPTQSTRRQRVRCWAVPSNADCGDATTSASAERWNRLVVHRSVGARPRPVRHLFSSCSRRRLHRNNTHPVDSVSDLPSHRTWWTGRSEARVRGLRGLSPPPGELVRQWRNGPPSCRGVAKMAAARF